MIFSFELWSDFGHFSHPATIYSSITYPIPPKTSIMGILAAIIGISDTADYIFLKDIKYSVLLINPIRKENFCFNGIKDALPSINLMHVLQKVRQRKQFYRELLVEPKYRIYIDLSKIDTFISQRIIQNIKKHISVFPVYLGINFCLANFKYIGGLNSSTISDNTEFVDINSFISLNSEFKIESGKSYSDIRFPTFLNEQRFFGGYTDLLVELNGNSIFSKPKEYITIENKEKIVMI